MMKKAFAAFLMLFAFACSAVAGDNALWEQSTLNKIIQRGELRVGLEAGYMPFEMKNKKGQIVGFDVDMAKAMAKAMGVKLKLVNTAWDGIIPALLTDKFDIIMSGMTITAERNLQVNFAKPYIIIGQTILIRKDLEGTIRTYSDLNDPKYTITSKLGTTGNIAVEKHLSKAQARMFETEADGALEVINGKADAFVYDLPYNAIYYAQNQEKLAMLAKPFTYEPLGWAVRKGDPDLMNWLNNFMRQIEGDGTYDRIMAKWFKSDRWLKEVQ